MAIIYTYPRMVTVNNGDLLLISAVNTPRKPTMRIRVEDVKGYMNTCPTITDCVGSTGNLNEVLTADGTGGVIWSPAGGGGAGVSSITTATGVSTGDPISPLAAATGAVTLTSNAYAGTTNVGYVPTGGSATTFLRGDGTWVTPAGAGTVGGSGTTDTLPMWTAASTLGDSLVVSTSGGNGIGINMAAGAPSSATFKVESTGAGSTPDVMQLSSASASCNIMLTQSGGTPFGYYGNSCILGGAATEMQLRSNNDLLFSSGGNTEHMRLKSAGDLQLPLYGSGTFTGTATFGLSVDANGNIIETAGGGAIPWPYQYDLGLRQLIQGENPGATGDATTAYGVEALTSITSGTSNTAIGTGAGYNITSSNRNTVIGSNAGYSLDGGAFPSSGENVLIGALAAENATNLIGTVAVGYGTLEGITINTSRNTAIGYRALAETTLNENTAVGYLSGFHSDAEYNVFIGSSCAAGDPLTPLSGDGNIFMGYLCGRTTQGASTDNVFIGRYAAENTKVISDSVIIGASAGKNYTGASTQDHVIIGANAGSGTLTGDNNIIIGYNAQPSTTIVSNEITIGNASHDRFRLPGGLPAFDDDAAAGVGGILTNMLYQTTGAGAAPLNAAGIVMIKQ